MNETSARSAHGSFRARRTWLELRHLLETLNTHWKACALGTAVLGAGYLLAYTKAEGIPLDIFDPSLLVACAWLTLGIAGFVAIVLTNVLMPTVILADKKSTLSKWLYRNHSEPPFAFTRRWWLMFGLPLQVCAIVAPWPHGLRMSALMLLFAVVFFLAWNASRRALPTRAVFEYALLLLCLLGAGATSTFFLVILAREPGSWFDWTVAIPICGFIVFLAMMAGQRSILLSSNRHAIARAAAMLAFALVVLLPFGARLTGGVLELLRLRSTTSVSLTLKKEACPDFLSLMEDASPRTSDECPETKPLRVLLKMPTITYVRLWDAPDVRSVVMIPTSAITAVRQRTL